MAKRTDIKSILMCLIISLFAICMQATASAAVTVHDQILQNGMYFEYGDSPECRAVTENSQFCACQTQISVPQISGLKDANLQEKINTFMRDQMSKGGGCPGKKLSDEQRKLLIMGSNNFASHYYLSFLNDTIFSYGYTMEICGAANCHWPSAGGYIIRLSDGHVYTVEEMFKSGENAEIQKVIMGQFKSCAEGGNEEYNKEFSEELEYYFPVYPVAGEKKLHSDIYHSDDVMTLSAEGKGGVDMAFTYECLPEHQHFHATIPMKFIGNKEIIEALKAGSHGIDISIDYEVPEDSNAP